MTLQHVAMLVVSQSALQWKEGQGHMVLEKYVQQRLFSFVLGIVKSTSFFCRVAAVEKAEAEKIQVVKAAEGDAESKYLQGQVRLLPDAS